MQYIDEYEPETVPMTLEELDCDDSHHPPESVPIEAKYDLHHIWSQFLKTVQFEYEEPKEEEPDDDDDSFFYEEHYDETAELEEDTEPDTEPDIDEDEDQLPGWTKQEDGWVVKVGTKKIVNVAK
jgi:hypothetical protein